MTTLINRTEAMPLLLKYNKEPFHLLHAFTVEGVMRWYAENLGYGICSDIEPIHLMEKVLFSSDELTGLIGAAVRMRPSGSVMDLEVSSLKKKFKDKKFAAGCSRDIIRQGAEMLGWELDELFAKTIEAMRACEESVRIQMEGLNKGA